MAKLKPAASGNSLAEPDVRVTLEQVLDHSRAAAAGLTPAQWAIVRAVRRDLGEASIGTPFDARAFLSLEGPALELWRVRQAEWARALLADDARIGSP